MTVPSTSDPGALCRLTVVAPKVRLDVAVPARVPLAHLLPTLLWHTGEHTAQAGAIHGGWALQRLGGAPLDTSASLTALGVRDGEILYFRPATAALPSPVFDDPVDGVSAILGRRPGRWSPASTRRCALVVMTLIPLLGLAPLLAHGPAWSAPATIAVVVAVVLLLGAGALSRAVGDGIAGVCCGLGSVPYAAFAGFALPLGSNGLTGAGAASAAGGGAAAFVAAVLAGAAVGMGVPPDAAANQASSSSTGSDDPYRAAAAAAPVGAALLAGAVPAAVIAGAGLAALHWNAAGCAAAAAAVTLALMVLIPRVAYRVAGLPPAAVATDAQSLRALSTPLAAGPLALRAVAADRIVTGAVAGSALAVAATAAFALRAGGGLTPVVVAADAAALLALRARILSGAAQRWWLIGCALVLAVVTGAVVPGRWPGATGTAVDFGVAAALAAGAGRFALRPTGRPSPPWARTADTVELLGVLALLPLALVLLGVFGYVRSLAG